MINRTKLHSIDQDFNENIENVAEIKLFLDLDMFIFSLDYDVYQSVINKIRDEFYLYDENTWIQGRIHFLNRLSQRQSIYYSEFMIEK